VERTPVESSAIASVGYDASSAALEIEFKNGSVYQYFGVPPAEHEAMCNADSVGKYFASNIRHVYPYARA
jgi:hypothetical protein